MATGVYQSQNMTVLAHLQAGHSITSWEAIERWKITRLARCVGDLKDEGYPIQSELLSANGKRYARYWLPQEKGQLSLFQQKGPVVEVHQALSCDALRSRTVSTSKQIVA